MSIKVLAPCSPTKKINIRRYILPSGVVLEDQEKFSIKQKTDIGFTFETSVNVDGDIILSSAEDEMFDAVITILGAIDKSDGIEKMRDANFYVENILNKISSCVASETCFAVCKNMLALDFEDDLYNVCNIYHLDGEYECYMSKGIGLAYANYLTSDDMLEDTIKNMVRFMCLEQEAKNDEFPALTGKGSLATL